MEKIKRNKKKAIIAILVALCLVGGAAGGYSYMTNTDLGKADVASQSDDKELTAEEKEKAAEEELEKAKKSGDKEAIEKAEKEVEKAKEKVNASNSNSSSNKGSYSKPSNSGSSSNTKPSKPSSGNSGSSGSSSSGSSTSKPSKPAHQHKWEPVYDERQVPYEVDEGYWAMICGNCGAVNPSEEHMENHWLKGEMYGKREEWVSNIVTKYKTEKHIDYYKCSCGAKK